MTRNFCKTILRRAEHDANFRRHMLAEAVNEVLSGDLDAGKAILRDYINVTITFQELAKKLKKIEQKHSPHARASRQPKS